MGTSTAKTARSLLKVLLLYFCLCGGVFASASKPAGLFSNMVYDQQSGDVEGFEFFFVYSKFGYYVLYQYSNGMPEEPKLVSLTIRGSDFEFTVPSGGEFSGKFIGKFTATGVQRYFHDVPTVAIKLKRGRSYWQR